MSQYDAAGWERRQRETAQETPAARRAAPSARVPRGVALRSMAEDHPILAQLTTAQQAEAIQAWAHRRAKEEPGFAAILDRANRECGFDVSPDSRRPVPSLRGDRDKLAGLGYAEARDSWYSVLSHLEERAERGETVGDGAAPDPDFDQAAIALAAAGLGTFNVAASHHTNQYAAMIGEDVANGTNDAERFRQSVRETARSQRRTTLDWSDGNGPGGNGGDPSMAGGKRIEDDPEVRAALIARGIDPDPDPYPERPAPWQESGEITDADVAAMSLEEFEQTFDPATNNLRPDVAERGYTYTPSGVRVRR